MKTKLTAVYLVLNEAEFIEHNLRQHYNYVDRIIVLEGADRRFPNEFISEDGMSTDSTRDVILSFPDPQKKIDYFPMGWTTKNDMARFYIKLIDAGWILRIDADEFYSDRNMRLIRKKIKNDARDAIIYPIINLWKSPQQYVTGGFFSIPHAKLFRWTDGCNFNFDHVRLCYATGNPYCWGKSLNKFWAKDIEMIHAGFARKNIERYEANIQYYINVGEKVLRPLYVESRLSLINGNIPPGCFIKDYSYKLPRGILNWWHSK